MNRMGSSSRLAHITEHRTIKDVTKALQVHFSAAKTPLSLPPESRRMLQHFVDEHEGRVSSEDAARANQELKSFYERFVGESPHRLGAFVGVLKELRPAITSSNDLWDWWLSVVKPVISTSGYKKQALDDAQDFLVNVTTLDEGEDDQAKAKLSSRLSGELLDIYMSRTRHIAEEDAFVAPENAQVASQVESVLLAVGKKNPQDLFQRIDDLVQTSSCRLQALTLLSSFAKHQVPHMYKVVETRLVESLLKCLMNDTSTTILSVALSTLIMLLPHIPGSLASHLPRLFLVYSRLLCWEKFSPLSTEAQRDLVTDDRVAAADEDDKQDPGDVGIDPSWEKIRPEPDSIEASTPELLTYFTYLYGLYPLNLMSYIRKPRKYLKNASFPGADDFDLDQAVIRSRSDQFREVHLAHPNSYSMVVEEELSDPKWVRMEPADVVAECNALCVKGRSTLVSPGPPPTSKLPDLPPFPPLTVPRPAHPGSGQISPVASHASFRSGTSWRETQNARVSTHSTDLDSPVLGPHMTQSDEDMGEPRPHSKGTNRTSLSIDDFPQPGHGGSTRNSKDRPEAPQTNLAYLQHEVTLLRNDLNFERWHKAQYSQHIGQVTRKNIKDATVEAETLNLINANRALKQQLEHLRNSREATLKDSALTRKQSNNMEAHMVERFRNMKKEQEKWMADAAELRRLRAETKQYRELLVACEARELSKSHELELLQRDMNQLQDVQEQLREASRRMREYEYREFEFERAKREAEILQNEKETLQIKMARREQDAERMKRAYASRIAELEAHLDDSDVISPLPRSYSQASHEMQMGAQQAIAESQAKLTALKKAHTRLLEKYTDLELEYQAVKSQLSAYQGGGNGQFFRDIDSGNAFTFSTGTVIPDRPGSDSMSGSGGMPVDSAYDAYSEYQAPASDPSARRYLPPQGMPVSSPPPQRNEATMHSAAGLTWRPPPVSRNGSMASRGSSNPPPATYNQTAPLTEEETVKGSAKSAFSDASVESKDREAQRPAKIQPKSEVRVYGRGKYL